MTTTPLTLNSTDIRAFIPAKDYAVSKAFYLALGFELQYDDGSIALFASGDSHFYLQNAYLQEWAENTMLHLTIDDALACFEQVSGVIATGQFPGARVAPPKQQPYGALVTHVHDPAGVLLHFAQWTNR